MQFQFTEVSNIQQQIEQLTAQLQQLTQSIAPYSECEAVASELVAKVAAHRALMAEKGLAQNSLNSWAIALYESGCNTKLGVVPDNSHEVLENQDYQERYDGIKAQVEQLQSERDRLIQQLKIRGDSDQIAHLEEINANLLIQLKDCELITETLENKIDDLQDELQDERQINASATLQRALLAENKIEELETKLAVIDGTTTSLRMSEEALKVEREALLQRIDALEKLTDELDQDLVEEGIFKNTSDRIRPFSNGTEYTSWTSTNCDRCQNFDNCEIASAIDLASLDDGTIDLEIAVRAGAESTNDGWAFPSDCNEFSPFMVEEKSVQSQLKEAVSRVIALRDIVSIPSGGMGEVTGFEQDGRILVAQTINKVRSESSYYRKEIVWVSSYVIPTSEAPVAVPTTPKDKEENKYEAFLAKIVRSSTAWNNLTWLSVNEVITTKQDFSELAIAKATKSQKEKRDILFNSRFAELLATHIQETNDASDLEWIPSQLITQVEKLLEKKSQGIPNGTEINVVGERDKCGELTVFIVKKHDTETDWVDCFDPTTKRLFSAYIDEASVISTPLPIAV